MRRRPAVHRILDDSVGRSARVTARFSSDLVIDRSHGGGTWASVMHKLPEDIKPWDHATSTFNMAKGSVVVWLSGNDVHNKRTGLGTIQDDMSRLRDEMSVTLKFLATKGPVSIVVLGPLPRLNGQSSGVSWERTASYHMERHQEGRRGHGDARVVPTVLRRPGTWSDEETAGTALSA